MKHSIIQEKSYAFAIRIIQFSKWLRDRKESELAGQVLRSGTAVGANVEEALVGTSLAEFVDKMSLAAREARGVHYWLRLLRDSGTVPAAKLTTLVGEAEELDRILTAIVKTGQRGRD